MTFLDPHVGQAPVMILYVLKKIFRIICLDAVYGQSPHLVVFPYLLLHATNILVAVPAEEMLLVEIHYRDYERLQLAVAAEKLVFLFFEWELHKISIMTMSDSCFLFAISVTDSTTSPLSSGITFAATIPSMIGFT